MEKTFIGVRDIDTEVFRKFRALAIQKNLKLGEALSKAMEKMIKEKINEEKKNKVNVLLQIKPLDFGKGTEKTSIEIDKILYGEG